MRRYFSALALLCAGAFAQTFQNPLFRSQDPWVTLHEGWYYYSDGDGDRIFIRRSRTLTGLARARPELVWTSTRRGWDGHANLWAPELHHIGGRWYLYFAADYLTDGRHFLYVLEGGENPLGPYRPGRTGDPDGQLVESTGRWAIDPNVFTGSDGALYITWSCTDDMIGKSPQHLCIARMADPLHIGSRTARIASPVEPWEIRGGPIAEGPVGYVRDGVTYLTYSASASWTTNDYAVGLLINRSGDLLNPGAWEKHGPIFDRHGRTYGPGSAVFAPSPDGSEWWHLYHAYDRLNCAQWACRSIRMQPFTWAGDGAPMLGYPYDPGVPHDAPSGDSGSLSGWGNSRRGAAASGEWATPDRFTAEDSRANGDRGEHRIFRGGSGMVSYRVITTIRENDRFRSGRPGEYGVYPVYLDDNNFVEAAIDPTEGLLRTRAVVAGHGQAEESWALPPEYRTGDPHRLEVAKQAGGALTFLLDGWEIGRRRVALDGGQAGVFARNAAVRFSEFSVDDRSHGWGDAPGDAARGLARSAAPWEGADGYARGEWTIDGAGSVASDSARGGWSALYRGNPNWPDTRIEAALRRTSGEGSYGLIVCHDDRNHHVSVWIDPGAHALRIETVAGGERSARSLALPSDFDPGRFHTLAAEKRGNRFTFFLDGTFVAAETAPLVNGVGGVATAGAAAEFRGFRFGQAPR